MKLKEVHPNKLTDKGERALAKMARIAACDTNFGGARALVLLKRLGNSQLPFDEVVTNTYHSNSIPSQYVAYECPECGTVCFGDIAALKHCFNEYDEEEAYKAWLHGAIHLR